jgi:hypothetical protein
MERETADWVWRTSRRRTNLAGIAKRGDGSAVRVLVSNLSYEGCHILGEGQLQKGEVIDLSLPRMSVIQAQVRWATGDSAGLKFIICYSVGDERRARLGV